jgi:hypothetical protein
LETAPPSSSDGAGNLKSVNCRLRFTSNATETASLACVDFTLHLSQCYQMGEHQTFFRVVGGNAIFFLTRKKLSTLRSIISGNSGLCLSLMHVVYIYVGQEEEKESEICDSASTPTMQVFAFSETPFFLFCSAIKHVRLKNCCVVSLTRRRQRDWGDKKRNPVV